MPLGRGRLQPPSRESTLSAPPDSPGVASRGHVLGPRDIQPSCSLTVSLETTFLLPFLGGGAVSLPGAPASLRTALHPELETRHTALPEDPQAALRRGD